ncbi:ExeA family protein [Bythopirellula polymerisocia]|uniref:ORC1/DEAH AAA+ ATPase domain-containing protein n=1 Tax=Bythopirellula polymerisocia TaxID=2528003 RepID=A0A5C6CV17_9BACT|nr:AAA family ATPase [Bythopirellula polymerisocia]TWU28430.1 hypothetical protein Pla144_17190 [Bythopirellula polymerisocia]
MEESSSISTTRRAFIAAPDPDRYFPGKTVEEARRRISRAIERGEGPALLIGGTGMGKTMLLEVLARQFYGKLSTVLLPGAQLCTRRALQQSILFQLGLQYREVEEGELRLSLLSHLRPRDGQPQRLLLLVDEADSLPTRLLEELRALTNITANGQVLVSLVLAGKPALEERFSEPELDAFSQRISQRCYLAAFGREETFQYLLAQVSAAAIEGNFFAQDGLEAIFTATDGVPRLVNQLGDQLVWLSDETGYAPIDGPIVQQAWSEIQQLPAPWNMQNAEPVGTSVEYGELSMDDELLLDESDEEVPSLIPMLGRDSGGAFGGEDAFFEPLPNADNLVDEFSGLEIAEQEKSNLFDTVAIARNPFQEEFASEEVVIDQYIDFEANVLTSAPRVINRLDTAFAQQLKMCEQAATADLPVKEPETIASTSKKEADIAIVEEDLEEIFELEESLPMPNSQTAKSAPALNRELLVIEDEVVAGPTVVSSKCFRQLFSSLETANTSQRFA